MYADAMRILEILGNDELDSREVAAALDTSQTAVESIILSPQLRDYFATYPIPYEPTDPLYEEKQHLGEVAAYVVTASGDGKIELEAYQGRNKEAAATKRDRLITRIIAIIAALIAAGSLVVSIIALVTSQT